MAVQATDLETVQRIYDRWAEGDWHAGEGLWSDDVVFVMDDPVTGIVAYEGRRAVTRYMREFLNAWTHVRHVADEIVAVGDDVVFVTARQIGIGKGSGVEAWHPTFAVWTFRDGKVVRLEHLRDRPTARAAAGLAD